MDQRSWKRNSGGILNFSLKKPALAAQEGMPPPVPMQNPDSIGQNFFIFLTDRDHRVHPKD